MKNLLLTFLIFSFSIPSTFAQDLRLDQVIQMGGTGDDQGYSVEIDVLGNVYSGGYFEDTVDFDPSSTVNNLVSSGLADIFIQKLDQNGNLIWVFSFGGIGYDALRDIKVESNGDILITGFFNDTVDFDASSAVSNLIATQLADIFILKLRSNGDFVWAKSLGGNSNDIANSIDTDLNGNILIGGQFRGVVDFDPDTSIHNLTSNGLNDIFILKLDSNGNFLWANSMGSSNQDAARMIKTDADGNIYTTGNCFAGTDFDPGSGTAFLPNLGGQKVFILKLDNNGNFLWVRGAVGPWFRGPYSFVLDSESSVHTTGYFGGTVDFDTDTGTYNLTSNGLDDVFIQKLDSSGNLVWAKSIGSSGDDQGFAIAIDSSNNLYTSGYFEDTVNFNTDSAGLDNLISNGDRDIFIQKLDKNGNFIWAESFGGSDWDQTRSIFVDQSDNIFATGYFRTTVDFDPDTNQTQSLTSNGFRDIFILKLNQCDNSFDSISQIGCGGFLHTKW